MSDYLTNLADSLPLEIAQAQDTLERWRNYARLTGRINDATTQIEMRLMRVEIEKAARALASGDASQMTCSLKVLKEYNDID
jgi:hypothetical protein